MNDNRGWCYITNSLTFTMQWLQSSPCNTNTNVSNCLRNCHLTQWPASKRPALKWSHAASAARVPHIIIKFHLVAVSSPCVPASSPHRHRQSSTELEQIKFNIGPSHISTCQFTPSVIETIQRTSRPTNPGCRIVGWVTSDHCRLRVTTPCLLLTWYSTVSIKDDVETPGWRWGNCHS